MLMWGSVPSSAVLLRPPPDSGLTLSLVAGSLLFPSLWEVFAAGPACLSMALPCGLSSCRRQDSAGLPSPGVQQPGCSVPCVWPEAVCVYRLCVFPAMYKVPRSGLRVTGTGL